ncbi:hypothetical protein [Pseudonocardia sp. MH-G8]|uniref:hypothetical protein n=1 Tax=Pseudonocardia sp. MH-G8 TaxID=1854588 RepID=UPI000BA02932|nr:hypothetical protein [Pseudonocardia sp. MH-G8]OZM75503.1 hypothetical protein CFP66_46040 [Pseudonocardia sp. MH-G8]
MTAAEQHHRPSAGHGTPDELTHALGSAARCRAPWLGLADTEAIVDVAGAMTVAGDDRDALDLAGQLGAAVDAVQERARTVFPDSGTRSLSWSAFGTVIPVLAGSAGAGASCIAVAITDALQQAQRCALLVDADDPARSGLTCASTNDGPWVKRVGDEVSVRYSWRDDALVARLSTELPTITPGMVPAPPDWLPDPPPDPLQATVIDLGHGGWRAAATPLYGAGAWLRRGLPSPHPILVVRATRPSLRQAEQLLARLEPWVDRGVATGVQQLVVNGARKWPSGVTGVAGPRMAALLDDAVFVPHQAGWGVAGVTDEPSPPRAVEALWPFLASWGLMPSPRRP